MGAKFFIIFIKEIIQFGTTIEKQEDEIALEIVKGNKIRWKVIEIHYQSLILNNQKYLKRENNKKSML